MGEQTSPRVPLSTAGSAINHTGGWIRFSAEKPGGCGVPPAHRQEPPSHPPSSKKSAHPMGERIFWWRRVDSNHRSETQQIYSLPPLATRELLHMNLCAAPSERTNGAGRRIRTPDLLITNQLLYQLSYTSVLRAVATLISLAEQSEIVNTIFRFFKNSFFQTRC